MYWQHNVGFFFFPKALNQCDVTRVIISSKKWRAAKIWFYRFSDALKLISVWWSSFSNLSLICVVIQRPCGATSFAKNARMKMWPDRLKQLHPQAFGVNKLSDYKFQKEDQDRSRQTDVNCMLSGVQSHKIMQRWLQVYRISIGNIHQPYSMLKGEELCLLAVFFLAFNLAA